MIHVPGTNDKFPLAAYKQAIGKEFTRLTFYVIPLEGFILTSLIKVTAKLSKVLPKNRICVHMVSLGHVGKERQPRAQFWLSMI